MYGHRVEEIDRAIVAALTVDGRLSYTDLAEKVGLSVSAAHQRVRRLEQRLAGPRLVGPLRIRGQRRQKAG